MISWFGKRVLPLTAAALVVAAPATAAPLTRADSSLLREMNRARTSRHLTPLRADTTLQRAARAHTEDMIQRAYFAHGDFALRMRRFRVSGSFAGENLAWGVGSNAEAKAIVAEWLASPEHRRNLLRPGFRRVGLGLKLGTFAGYDAATVVTADFAGA